MKITNKHIFFYTEWPSNFRKTSFEFEGFGEKHHFFCTEQAFMLDVNFARFTQDKILKEKILNPEYDGKTFVEASPTDRIWGIGLGENDPDIDDERHWFGQNLLGKVLTDVRNRIKHDGENKS